MVSLASLITCMIILLSAWLENGWHTCLVLGLGRLVSVPCHYVAARRCNFRIVRPVHLEALLGIDARFGDCKARESKKTRKGGLLLVSDGCVPRTTNIQQTILA